MAFGGEDLDLASEGGSDDLDLGSDTGDTGDGSDASDSFHEDGESLDDGDGGDEQDGLDIADDSDGEDQPAAEGESKPVTNDGRTLPADVKQALKAVQATNPTAAGKLRDAVFTAKAFSDVFATPADAVKAKDFLDGVGGEDGFKGLQASLEEWSGVEKAFQDGSPDFVKRLVNTSPEAFQKMAPNVINQWAQSAPEAFGYFQSSVALNAFRAAGITTEALQSAYAKVGDNPQAKVLIEDVFNALSGLQTTASKFKSDQAQRNPEREKLDAERKAFEDSRQSEFETDLATKTDSYTQAQAAPWLKQYIGTQPLAEGVKAAINKDLITEIGTRLSQIPGFDARLDSLVKSRNSADALMAVQQQIDKIVSISAKTVVERYTRVPGQTAKPGQAGKKPAVTKPGQSAPSSTGSLRLNSAPSHGQIEWAKTTKSQYISGEGTLKDGRKASWM